MTVRRPPQKSASVTIVLVTLQRAPPLTRIFAPRRLAPSSRTTEMFEWRRRVKIAVARPAAPAPTIATSAFAALRLRRDRSAFAASRLRRGRLESRVRRAVYAALIPAVTSSPMNTAASLTTVEIAPHALHRNVFFVGSSELPMTSVRWLPHFGHTGGVLGRCETSSLGVN
jgi:hypothetical protein